MVLKAIPEQRPVDSAERRRAPRFRRDGAGSTCYRQVSSSNDPAPMRHLIIEEPVSRAAIWSVRIAWFALAVTLIAILLLRFQRVELLPGFASLAAGLALAVMAVALSIAAFVRIWMEGRRGLRSAVGGLLISFLVLGWPGWHVAKALTLPVLNDVATDTENPPAFSRSRVVLEARRGRIPPDPSPETRAKQRDAYPQVAPLTLDVPADEAFELARKAATNRGWEILEAVAPGGRIGLGRIEAIDRTFLLRLPDDIAVRIRPRADGTRIDVRSASRIGAHDLGQNAQRVRSYLEEVSNLAIALK
jgi:uncharacterized protein (DUF1499 family)